MAHFDMEIITGSDLFVDCPGHDLNNGDMWRLNLGNLTFQLKIRCPMSVLVWDWVNSPSKPSRESSNILVHSSPFWFWPILKCLNQFKFIFPFWGTPIKSSVSIVLGVNEFSPIPQPTTSNLPPAWVTLHCGARVHICASSAGASFHTGT